MSEKTEQMFKKVKHATAGVSMWSSACQCSFPSVFEMKKNNLYPESKPEYAISLLVDKTDPMLVDLKSIIKNLMDSKYGVGKWPANWHRPMKDGDLKADKYPEMAGKVTIKINNKQNKPTVLDVRQQELFDSREIYPGAYVRVKFNAYLFKNPYHGVGLSLRVVQKIADAEPFGGSDGPENLDDIPELDATFVPETKKPVLGETSNGTGIFNADFDEFD